MIPLGDYKPDLPALGTQATVANNCVPAVGYYAPFYSPVAYTASGMAEAATKAVSFRSATGIPYNFAGTESKLYKITSAAWEDVSVGGGYASSTNKWDFCAFGNRAIATNYANYPQSFVMGTDTDFSNLTTTFKAKTVAVVRGFVMFGFINDGTEYRNMVRWSADENPTDYTPSITTQSDYQQLFGESDVGSVQRIVGGEYATIFMERGIFRGTYVGGQTIFTFDQIARELGTPAPGSVASFGEMIFFLGHDGFYQMTSAGIQAIGEGSVNRTFLNEVYTAGYDKITSIIDPARSLYIIAYPVSSGNPTKFLIYNWIAQKWTTSTPGELETLFIFLAESMTTDGASSFIGNLDSGTYADVPVDSALFIGGQPALACIDSNHKACTYNGEPLEATFETAETQITPMGKTTVTNIIPMIEGSGSSVYASVGYRNTPQESIGYSNEATYNLNGECNLFNTARYQRARLRVVGGFTKAYGISWNAKSAGRY